MTELPAGGTALEPEQLAAVLDAAQRLAATEAALADAHRRLAAAQAEVRRQQEIVREADVRSRLRRIDAYRHRRQLIAEFQASTSWKLTALVRRARQLPQRWMQRLTTALLPVRAMLRRRLLPYDTVLRSHYVGWLRFLRRGRPRVARPDNSGAAGLPLLRFGPREKGRVGSVLRFDEPTPVPTGPLPSICVHLGIANAEDFAVFAEAVDRIEAPFTLLASIPAGEPVVKWRAYLAERVRHAERIEVRSSPAGGETAMPWGNVFQESILAHEILCHLHSLPAGGRRQRYVVHSLLGSQGVVNQILAIFSAHPQVGVVGPCSFGEGDGEPSWGSGRAAYAALYAVAGGGAFPETCPDYPADGCFWARTRAIAPLLQPARDDRAVVADGVERCLGMAACLAGMTYHPVTVDVAFDLTRYVHRRRQVLSPSVRRSRGRASDAGRASASARTAIYTCNAGGYDEPLGLVAEGGGIDQVLFTDRIESTSAAAGVCLRVSPYVHAQPVRTARFVKTHPHVWFPEHDYACWIDANIHFSGDIRAMLDKLDAAGADCGFILHPLRDSFVDEAEEIMFRKKADVPTVQRQVDRYVALDGLEQVPLFETNFFVCRPRAPAVQRMFRIWWSEIDRFSHRDQLSICYAVHASGCKWIPLIEPGRSTRDHPDFIHFEHDRGGRSHVVSWLAGGAEGLA